MRHGAPKTGELFEQTFSTPQGPVDLLAEVVVEGSTLFLKDITVYARTDPPPHGLQKEVFAARKQLMRDAKAWGFTTLRLTGHRVLNSSSANPDHSIDVTIDLTR